MFSVSTKIPLKVLTKLYGTHRWVWGELMSNINKIDFVYWPIVSEPYKFTYYFYHLFYFHKCLIFYLQDYAVGK